MIEETTLKKKNVRYIARRSGKTLNEVEALLKLAQETGRQGMKLRYTVVEDQGPAERVAGQDLYKEAKNEVIDEMIGTEDS